MDTVGGVTSFEPRETTSATGAPGSSTLPAAGVELITRPAGIVSLNAVVTAPTVKPAPVISVVAVSLKKKTKYNSPNCVGAVYTTDSDTARLQTTLRYADSLETTLLTNRHI